MLGALKKTPKGFPIGVLHISGQAQIAPTHDYTNHRSGARGNNNMQLS